MKTRPEIDADIAEAYRLKLSQSMGRNVSLSEAVTDALRRAEPPLNLKETPE